MKWPDQHLKNLDILKLIREDHGWALSRILLAEELEAERDALREALEKIDRPGRPEPERGIARAALERHHEASGLRPK